MQKKIIIALVVSTTIAMQACSDKENNQKEALKAVAETSLPVAAVNASGDSLKVIATVDGVAIKKFALDGETKYLQRLLAMRGGASTMKQLPALRKEALESLIGKKLLQASCQKKGVKADEKQVQGRVDSIRKRFKSDADFEKVLAKQQLTIVTLKEQIAQDMAIKKFIDEKIVKHIIISVEEAKKFYTEHPEDFKQQEQVKARHILIKVAADATAEQKEAAHKKIDEIKKEIAAGKDFATLAKKYSQGPSASRGGDLGYFSKGRMVKAFETAAFALKPPAVSDLVETKFGYHLIKVEEKKAASTMKFEEVKEKLTAMLKQTRIQKEVKEYIESLKKEAKIEIFLKS